MLSKNVYPSTETIKIMSARNIIQLVARIHNCIRNFICSHGRKYIMTKVTRREVWNLNHNHSFLISEICTNKGIDN